MTYKQWANLEILTASDLNTVLAQAVPRFTSTSERSASIASPATGQLSYVDGNGFQIYTGAAWENVVPTGRLLPAGGTTGQVLKKLSNADYDAGWVTP